MEIFLHANSLRRSLQDAWPTSHRPDMSYRKLRSGTEKHRLNACLAANYACLAANKTCPAANKTCLAANKTCLAANKTCFVADEACRVANKTCFWQRRLVLRQTNLPCGKQNLLCDKQYMGSSGGARPSTGLRLFPMGSKPHTFVQY